MRGLGRYVGLVSDLSAEESFVHNFSLMYLFHEDCLVDKDPIDNSEEMVITLENTVFLLHFEEHCKL